MRPGLRTRTRTDTSVHPEYETVGSKETEKGEAGARTRVG